MHRYLLEIRVPRLVNNCRGSYERKALPTTHSWRDMAIAVADDRDELVQYAEQLPVECFYDGQRRYKIYDRLAGHSVCAER